MEYSKEDLMEAKKQIWGVGENMGTEESKSMLSAGMHYAAGGGAESATGGLGQMNVDHMASSFASGWSDFGTVLGGSMTDLRNTIAGAQWGGSGSGQSGFSGGGFSGSGFGGASGGIGGGSFGGR